MVELFRFGSKKLTAFRDDKSAVRGFESARERLYFWCATFLEPTGGYCSLYLEMDFVLIYKNQRIVFFNFGSFFLKASRSSVPS